MVRTFAPVTRDACRGSAPVPYPSSIRCNQLRSNEKVGYNRCSLTLQSPSRTRKHEHTLTIKTNGTNVQIKVEQHLCWTRAKLEDDLKASSGIITDERDCPRVANDECRCILGKVRLEDVEEMMHLLRRL